MDNINAKLRATLRYAFVDCKSNVAALVLIGRVRHHRHVNRFSLHANGNAAA